MIARTPCSSTMSGLVRSWAAAWAVISYWRLSLVKPANRGCCIVILVPDTTRCPSSIGTFVSTRSGLSQVVAASAASTRTATLAGIATRRKRTHRLWRTAVRNTRSSSPRPTAAKTCAPAWSKSDTAAKWFIPRPPPARESGGPPAILTISRGHSRPQIWPGRGTPGSRMGEDVLGRPAGQVQPHPVGEEAEAGRRQFPAPLARQHGVEPLLQGVQMQHVGSRIGYLGIAERLGAPIGELLLLRQVDPEHVAHQILEAVLVGVGAREPRRDLGAIDRPRHDAEGLAEDAEIEAGEMKDLEDARVGHELRQVRRGTRAGRYLHHVG